MKTLILVFTTIGGIAGAYVPALWGDTDIFSVASILFGMIGGLVGIWLAVVVAKRVG